MWWQSNATFELDPSFVASYATRQPDFGFNGLGELTYYRTYSRVKPDGTNERWHETVARVVRGTYRMQERWIKTHGLPWKPEKAQRSAQEMYERLFTMKFIPSGRGLWAMGSGLTEERGLYAALQSCAFVSTADLHKEPAEPFCWLMEASMLGVGVGFDTKGAEQVEICAPTGEITVQIPDDREGWVDSLRQLLTAYFVPGHPLPVFDYSLVRPAGSPIKGFGGISAGPGPLKELHETVQQMLQARVGTWVDTTMIVDIMNLIGKAIVAGNVRRCLPEGTLVHTSEGLIPIEAIRPGMLAKTSRGYAEISELVPQGVQPVWALQTQLGEFRATARHQMAVLNSIGGYEWKQLQQLAPGDRVVFVGAETSGTATELPRWTYERPNHSTTCQDLTIPALDAETAWLVGLIQGDGYVYANRKEGGFNAYVSVACSNEYPEIITQAARALLRFGVNVSEMPRAGEACTTVRAQSKQLAWYLDEHVKQPKTAIRTPTWILRASAEVRAAYVAGVFDSDGHDGRPLQVASSVYPEFLRDVQAVLASLGIPTRFKLHREASGTTQALYQLNVVGESARTAWEASVAPYALKYEPQEGRRRSGHDFGFPREWVLDAQLPYGRAWTAQSAQMTVATAERCGAQTHGLVPVEVLAVLPDVGVANTYDIAVPAAREFVAQEGLLVHNTAEIAFGDPNDAAFLDLKNYEVNPHRAAYGWTSNNSIFAELGQDYTAIAERIRLNGEPGLAWLENMRHYSRMGEAPDHKDWRVAGGNPCVPAGTRILTRDGYVPIETVVDTTIEVWNGEQFSEVTPQVTGTNEHLVTVTLSDGRKLDCTLYHEFVLANGSRKEADDLQPGDEVLMTAMPVVDAGAPTPGLYSQPDADTPFHVDVPSRLAWLAGLYDTYGAVGQSEYGTVVALDRPVAVRKDVQLLLTTLGVTDTINDTDYLFMGVTGWHQLTALGMQPQVLPDVLGGTTAFPPVTVKTKRDRFGRAPEVYCFTEPMLNQGTFEGIVTGQCLEQSLESYELCNLVETFPARHDSLDDYLRTLKFAYLYAKTVALGPTTWDRTNQVMARNRRIGLSQSGIVQAIAKLGIEDYRYWCEQGYQTVRDWDAIYSEWMAVPLSVKTTSVKPAGSTSLLAGATPGLHHPESLTYVRRMRLSVHSPLVEALRAANYPLEPAFGSEDTTVVVEIPVRLDDNIRTVGEVSMWEQLSLAAFMSEYWADNQVSITCTFDPATEGPQIAHALNYFQYKLKGVSFLPRLPKGAYPQMPYEAITDEEYERRLAQLRPLRIGHINEEAEAERFCSNDTCTL